MVAGLSLGLLALGIFLLCADAPWQGSAAKLLKKGKSWEVAEYVQVGLWWAGAGVGVLLLGLLATLPVWWKWSEREVMAKSAVEPRKPWELWVLLAALVAGGWLRIPLMDQGIKWDEHDNLRRNFHGLTLMDQAQKGNPWRAAGYREAFFENERSNNPFLYSVLAHASLDAWRVCTGLPRDRFNVVAIRIPALLAGLGGLLTAWLLARRVGGAWVAALTVWLLVMHPLHVRYSVDARGYSLVLLLGPVFLQCALSLVERGSWRMAFATTFTAATILYAFPGAVYFVGMGGVALMLALWSQRGQAARGTFVRLCVAGGLALAVLVFLLAPALMQAARTLDAQFQKTGMPTVWLVQTWHWMTTGVHLPGDQEYYDLRDGKLAWGAFLQQSLASEFFTAVMAWVVIPVLTILGIAKLRPVGPRFWIILLPGIAAPLACLMHHGLLTHYGIFQWYMVYALPVHFLILSMGLTALPSRLLPWSGVVLLGLFWLATNPRQHASQRGYVRWEKDHGLPTARSVFHRGTNTYETWADGRVLRLPKETAPPPTSP